MDTLTFSPGLQTLVQPKCDLLQVLMTSELLCTAG